MAPSSKSSSSVSTNATFELAFSELQTYDQKIDFLARAVGHLVSDSQAGELKDWSDNQRGVFVNPDVRKAQAALEEAQEKAAS